MQKALAQADKAEQLGEVPIGAVLVKDDELVSEGLNLSISNNDPTAHAEIVAIRKAAAKLGNYRLSGTRLYVTIEPCTMCAGALIHSRISELVYGASEPRAGAAALLADARYNHQVQVKAGVLEEQAASKMTQFFQAKRRDKQAANAPVGQENS